ncbi:unnamed protein product [Ectocarpus sp. 12 AP-2014]
MKERRIKSMSSTQQGTTLILASVAVCLLIFVTRRQLQGGAGRPGERRSAKDGPVQQALGAARKALGLGLDCANINPGHADWARCAQGSAKGRVPTKNPSGVLNNPSRQFADDSMKFQGLGVNRLQDDFVHDQFSGPLGAPRPGGMRIDKSNLKNNAFFSKGTQNASSLVTSGISSEGAAAFPFSRKSGDEPGESFSRSSSGNVSSVEPLGMGMSFADFKRKVSKAAKTAGIGGERGMFDKSAFRSQVDKKQGVAPFDDLGSEFNPFTGDTSSSVGATGGLKLSEAYDTPKLGMGSNISHAFGKLGAAVSPISSSDAGVSPEEIVAATSALKEINIVQSTGGKHIDRFIRPSA